MPQNINKTFNLRYEKFKKSTLPTPFWDKERQVLEYVFYDKNEYNVCNNLTDALSDKFSKSGKFIENLLSKSNTLLFISLFFAIIIYIAVDQNCMQWFQNSNHKKGNNLCL